MLGVVDTSAGSAVDVSDAYPVSAACMAGVDKNKNIFANYLFFALCINVRTKGKNAVFLLSRITSLKHF